VQRVTDAPESLAADQARRTRNYLWQMGLRVLCFLLAVLLWPYVPLWVSLTLVVGAVVLPYVAVLLVNAGRERRDPAPPGVLLDPRLLGTGGPAPHDTSHDTPIDPAPPASGEHR
jgi:hypothetical protein